MPSSYGTCMAPEAIAYRRKHKLVRGKIWKKGAIMDANAHVAYMTDVPVKTREEAEELLCKGFGIAQSNSLQTAICLNERLVPARRTRSGRMSRGAARHSTPSDDTWLVWVTNKDNGRILGTAIVSMMANNKPVLLYITVEPNPYVRGRHVLGQVLAFVKQKGHSMLLSAVDDNQTGQAFGGNVHCSAKAAHAKWGFHEIGQAEWRRHCPDVWYDRRENRVTLMKKVLDK